MATDSKQLLNLRELYNKLGGGSSSSNEIKDAGAISSTWGGNVYIIGGLSGTVVPNNGEIRPVFNFKYGATASAAYNTSSLTSVNVKDDSWDSSAAFSINDSTCYFYNGSSAASVGYYMESNPISGTSDSYNYYKTISGGKVSESGIYIPEYFNWDNQTITVDRDGNYVYAPYSTNDSNISVYSKYRASVTGTITSTTDSSLSIDVQSSYPRLRLARDQINSNFPVTLVTVKGAHFNTDYYHELLVVPPWDIYGSNITGVSSSGDRVTPTVNTNMGGYTLSSNKSWATVSGNNVVIDANTNPGTRTATITATGRVSGTWSTIAYDSGNVSGTFTITQNGANVLIYILVDEQERSTCYVSTVNNDFNHLIHAPKKIFINNIVVRVGNQTYPGSCEISQGSFTGTISWDYGMPTDQYITFDSVGDVIWEYNTPPTGYEFGNTNLIWL